MRFYIAFLHLLLAPYFNFSQEAPDLNKSGSHEYYITQLNDAKDINFQKIISRYDDYIAKNPSDIIAQVERCKFIGNSYYDEYEDYNLKYEETEECINVLYEQHPTHPKVLIYKAQNEYGEERLEVLNKAKELIETHRTDWLNLEIAEIYKMLGDYHQDTERLALLHYKKAQKLNDSLDLSLAIAKLYEAQGKNDLALETLLPNLEKDTLLWNMNQKADLLLKLNEPEKALFLYDIIKEKDSTYINNEEMASAMTDLGNLSTAREFLVRDTIKDWGKMEAKQRLFSHDLKYSNGEVALATYRELQEESPYDDFFGIKRFRLFLKSPFLQWKPSEAFHFALLCLLVIVALIAPYLWILPVYGIKHLLSMNGFVIRPKLNFSWSIGHFWLLSFFYLIAQVVTVFVFEYQDTMNYYFDLGSMYGEEEVGKSTLAGEMILFVLFMASTTLIVLGRKKIKDVFRSNLRVRQMIGLSIIFVIFNRVVLKVLGFFVDLGEPDFDFNLVLSAEKEILAVMSQHGFLMTALLVAVIVPIYEEIVFRGVILGSVEKYIGFKGANVFQAALFALVHDDLSLFPFFFIFALVTGYWVKRSKGLLTGIFFHGIHNFTILLGLYYLSKLSLLGG